MARPSNRLIGILSLVRVFVEFASALARERARSTPTLLLLDGSGWTLDEPTLADLARRLLSQPFQTIMTLNNGRRLDDDPVWESWTKVRLRKSSAATLTQIL